MSPRPDVSQERKAQIITAATDVFTRLGFQKARMDDIVEESGLSKGALYWYFKSKDDIIIGILDRLFQRELDDLRLLVTAETPTLDRLYAFSDRVIEDFKKLERFLPILLELVALAIRSKVIQKAFKTYFRQYLEIITPILQQGIDSGELRAVDAKEAALAMGAIFEGTALLWVYDSENVDMIPQMRSGSRIFLDGLKAKD